MHKKSEFIAAAIQDCQETIRATDVKVGALLTGLLLPFSKISEIWTQLEELSKIIDSQIVTYAFFSLWFLAIFSLVRTISAIDNPASHIIDENTCKGTFFGGGLYSFGFWDSFLNRDIIKANRNIASFTSTYPKTSDEIEMELSFEHMKLIYIREIKIHRLHFSLRIATACFIVGICAFLCIKLNS